MVLKGSLIEITTRHTTTKNFTVQFLFAFSRVLMTFYLFYRIVIALDQFIVSPDTSLGWFVGYVTKHPFSDHHRSV